MNEYIVILTTIPNKEIGQKISLNLVKERLAACVNLLSSCESYYWWEEQINRDEEFILFIKTRAELFSKTQDRIKELHPDKVPEIISLPIHKGLPPYLQWIDEETRGQ